MSFACQEASSALFGTAPRVTFYVQITDYYGGRSASNRGLGLATSEGTDQMARTPLLLILHCQATGPGDRAPITTGSRLTATLLAERLAALGVDMVYSAPARAAQDTLAPFADTRHLALVIDDRLAERKLSSEPRDDAHVHTRKSFRDPDYRVPNADGESLNEAVARAFSAFRDIATRGHAYPAVCLQSVLMGGIIKHFDPAFDFHAWQALPHPDLYRIEIDADQVETISRLAA